MRSSLSGLALTLLSSGLFLVTPAAQGASITGDTITCSTNALFTCSGASAVDFPGVEFSLTQGANTLTADFGSSGLVITDTAASNQSFTDTFGPGIDLIFTDSTNPFTSATFISASAPTIGTGFGAGNLSFSGGTVTLNISGIAFTGGGTVDIGLTTGTATAPEPGTLALTGSSMILALFWMRSRKKT
jgi:hypothetical protein